LWDAVAQFGLCGLVEVEAAQVGDPGSLERGFGPPGVQSDEVDRGGGEGVFQLDFRQPGAAGGRFLKFMIVLLVGFEWITDPSRGDGWEVQRRSARPT
jgi:hypothetical protein